MLVISQQNHNLGMTKDVMRDSNSHVAAAAHYARSDKAKDLFWGVFFALGSLLPIAMLCIALFVPDTQPALLAFAGVLALIGIFTYEHCFVKAGQIVPLS